METMLEAVARLQDAGYRREFTALPGGRLRCGGCGEIIDAGGLTVEDASLPS